MKPDAAGSPKGNLIGSLWMMAAMAGFAIEDGLIKAVSQTVPLGQILMIFGFCGAFVFATIARIQKTALFTKDAFSTVMCIRAVFEIAGRLFYALAIVLIPLSAATVILQATPIVVVAGAALIFGEQVRWRRWLAILVGLVGVMIILQPGSADFSALSILAVIGMMGFAGRDLASRAAPVSLSASVLGFYGFLAMGLVGVVVLLWNAAPLVLPQPIETKLLFCVIIAGVAAYFCLMKAMRTGEVSAVTPFRYSRLIFGVALGVFWFGETLTPHMIFGSLLIVISGLFILWRGNSIQE